jgi:serine protease
MRIAYLIAAVLAAVAFHAAAERTPPRPMPLSESADEARVIVRFKEGASVLRAHALSAGAAQQAHIETLDARASALGARHGMALRSGAAVGEHVQVMHGPAGMTSQALADQLLRDADVAWAEPDRRVRRALVPNDTLFAAGGAQGPAAGQWYLRAPAGEIVSSINAVTAWDTTTGSDSVIVAVLDTGVRPDHPDLAGKLVAGYDFVTNESGKPAISNDGNDRDNDPSDPGDWLTQAEINANPTFWDTCQASSSSWHGTQVSGLVGAATGNGAGMAGVGWNVRVMPVRVLGKCFGYTSDIQAAMRWAAGLPVPGVPANPNPAQVINLSLGGSAGACSSAWAQAVNDVIARGVVVVAAAGNGVGRAASSPANCPGVIGVAGVRHVGSKVGFSDIGPEVSIAAPGGNCVNLNGTCLYPILSTADSGQTAPAGASYTGGGADAAIGTSFSSPLVAATAALMLSVKSDLSPQAVRAAMQSSARPFPSSGLNNVNGVPLQSCRAPGDFEQDECYCTTATCGAGMLDASAAVAAALSTPTPNPTPTPTPTPAPTGDGGGGGGGSMSPAWLLALVAAALLLMRRPSTRLRVVGVSTLLLAAAAPAAAAAGEPMVNGLIVQLRDAPSHAALRASRERAQALGMQGSPDTPMHAREQARWQGVVAAMPSLRVAERHAVGESAQLMRFERPLTAAQAQDAAAQLAQRPDVAWVVPNARERRLQATAPANAPSDPFYPQQWWLQLAGVGSSGAPNTLRAWTSITTGSAGSLVAVLDNGIVDHPDLAGKVIRGVDMVADSTFSNDGDGRDTDPNDPGDWVDSADLAKQEFSSLNCQIENSTWHGTAIAGMLAANTNNGEGGASMNWPGRVLAVRVAAKCGADVADIVDGMRWAAGFSDVCRRSDTSGNCLEFFAPNQNPVRVINISFGGDGACDAYQPTIDALRARGIVVIAAAGNEHNENKTKGPTRPAKCPGVIGVAALNRDGFKATYSNFGPMLAVATVGGDNHVFNDDRWASVADTGVLSVGNNGTTVPGASGYFDYFGTSFSTPVVAGAVSLMLAVNPALTAAQIEQGLRASARPHVQSTVPGVAACSNANPGRCLCTTATCGAGILDVEQALIYARDPQAYVAQSIPAVMIDNPPLREAAAGGPDRPANAGEPPSGGGGGSSDSGGGGAMSALWLLALGAAVLALRRRSASR